MHLQSKNCISNSLKPNQRQKKTENNKNLQLSKYKNGQRLLIHNQTNRPKLRWNRARRKNQPYPGDNLCGNTKQSPKSEITWIDHYKKKCHLNSIRVMSRAETLIMQSFLFVLLFFLPLSYKGKAKKSTVSRAKIFWGVKIGRFDLAFFRNSCRVSRHDKTA